MRGIFALQHSPGGGGAGHADPASPVRLNHAEVLAARDGIVALIEVLRSEQTVAPRGVALARLLTVERGSPMPCEGSQRLVRGRSE